MRDDGSRGTVRINSRARSHGVSGKVNQNIQIGLGDALCGGEIIEFADVGKALCVGAKRIGNRIVFAGLTGRNKENTDTATIVSGNNFQHPASHHMLAKIGRHIADA